MPKTVFHVIFSVKEFSQLLSYCIVELLLDVRLSVQYLNITYQEKTYSDRKELFSCN